VSPFTWDDCWRGYRHQAFHGLMLAFISPMLVARTARGDALFKMTFARHAQHAIDLACAGLLPAPSGARG
jgi:hypothetical protein